MLRCVFALIPLLLSSLTLASSNFLDIQNKKMLNCDKSPCREVSLPSSLVEPMQAQAVIDSVKGINGLRKRACSSVDTNMRQSFLQKNTFSICSVNQAQAEKLQAVAVTSKVGNPKTPTAIRRILKGSFSPEELAKLKGRTMTIISHFPKFRLNQKLPPGGQSISVKYGNDRIPYISDKTAILIDGVNVPDDQGLTGSIGVEYIKNNGELVEIRAGLDFELRTNRFGDIFLDQDGNKTAKQFAQEKTTLSLEAVKFSEQMNNFQRQKGVKVSFIDVNAHRGGVVKELQHAIHEAQDMLLPQNIAKEELSEQRLEISIISGAEKHYHQLISDCYFKVGVNGSIGFTTDNNGNVGPVHSLSFNSSISKYIKSLGTEVALNLELESTYHNLSEDNWSPTNSSKATYGFQNSGRVELGLRKGQYGLLLGVEASGDKGLDEDDLYYEARAIYFFKPKNQNELLLTKNPVVQTNPSSLNKTQLLRPTK